MKKISHKELATKVDLLKLQKATKADLLTHQEATKKDISHLEKAMKADLLTHQEATKKDISHLEKAMKADLLTHQEATKADLLTFQEHVDRRFSAHDSQFEIVLSVLKDSITYTQKQMQEMEERLTQTIYNAVSEHDLVLTDHSKRIGRLERKVGV